MSRASHLRTVLLFWRQIWHILEDDAVVAIIRFQYKRQDDPLLALSAWNIFLDVCILK